MKLLLQALLHLFVAEVVEHVMLCTKAAINDNMQTFHGAKVLLGDVYDDSEGLSFVIVVLPVVEGHVYLCSSKESKFGNDQPVLP